LRWVGGLGVAIDGHGFGAVALDCWNWMQAIATKAHLSKAFFTSLFGPMRGKPMVHVGRAMVPAHTCLHLDGNLSLTSYCMSHFVSVAAPPLSKRPTEPMLWHIPVVARWGLLGLCPLAQLCPLESRQCLSIVLGACFRPDGLAGYELSSLASFPLESRTCLCLMCLELG
jgi:hypothetical protein